MDRIVAMSVVVGLALALAPLHSPFGYSHTAACGCVTIYRLSSTKHFVLHSLVKAWEIVGMYERELWNSHCAACCMTHRLR
jgi:hypothetical protein